MAQAEFRCENFHQSSRNNQSFKARLNGHFGRWHGEEPGMHSIAEDGIGVPFMAEKERVDAR